MELPLSDRWFSSIRKNVVAPVWNFIGTPITILSCVLVLFASVWGAVYFAITASANSDAKKTIDAILRGYDVDTVCYDSNSNTYFIANINKEKNEVSWDVVTNLSVKYLNNNTAAITRILIERIPIPDVNGLECKDKPQE